MTRVGWLSFGLGATAAALVLLPLSGGAQARDGATAAALPDRLASYSHRTADLSDAPSGRAVALYQRGFGVEFLDTPQALSLIHI